MKNIKQKIKINLRYKERNIVKNSLNLSGEEWSFLDDESIIAYENNSPEYSHCTSADSEGVLKTKWTKEEIRKNLLKL